MKLKISKQQTNEPLYQRTRWHSPAQELFSQLPKSKSSSTSSKFLASRSGNKIINSTCSRLTLAALIFACSLAPLLLLATCPIKVARCQGPGDGAHLESRAGLPAVDLAHLELARQRPPPPAVTHQTATATATAAHTDDPNAGPHAHPPVQGHAHAPQVPDRWREATPGGDHEQLEAASSEGFGSSPEGSGTMDALAMMGDDERSDALTFGQPFDYHSNMPVITKRELANAIKQATANVRRLRDTIEPGLISSSSPEVSGGSSNGPLAMTDSPSWLANSMFHKPALDAQSLNQSTQALISEEATRLLTKQYRLNKLQTMRGLPLISVDQTNLGKLCPRPARTFNCVPGRYRSFTGHCNNVQNPDWGAARTPLARYAPARYADNIARPLRTGRGSLQHQKSQQLLPSARAVSMAVYDSAASGRPAAGSETTDTSSGAIGAQHSHMTTMLSFFGQFVFHDLVYVAQYTGSERNQIKCCRQMKTSHGAGAQQTQAQAPEMHSECFPIELGPNYCLDYVRSTPAVRAGCNLGARDQLNLVSSFLDGSAIYGSSEEQVRRLRTFVGGRLRSQKATPSGATNGGGTTTPAGNLELLPQIKLAQVPGMGNNNNNNNNKSDLDAVWAAAAEDCKQMALMKRSKKVVNNQQQSGDPPPVSPSASAASAAATRCFQAGDDRVNENIGLTLMHTIWLLLRDL